MSEENLRPSYDDDQVNEDVYKRGAQSKLTKARKADFDEDNAKEEKRDKKAKADGKHVDKRPKSGPRLGENGNPLPKEPRLPKRKVAVMVGYCGTGYHGMQYNPPNPTIESTLFKAFVEAGAISRDNSNDLKKNGFMRAARTDKGVHAGGNLISLKMIIEDPDIKEKINDKLPQGIRVWDIERVNKAFDCRKMCSSRWYEYLLPTYSLIGPKPGSILYRDIEESKVELPGVLDEDLESKEFWEEFKRDANEKFTPEDIEAVLAYVPPARDEFNINEELYQKVKKYKQLENAHRRKYRISDAKLAKFRASTEQYLGAHNFHNFTLGRDFKEPSAIRFMKEINVSDPFVIGEAQTEWVSVKIHGQSFMLHQIRKMISMATLITRCGCPVQRITQAYGQQKINVPKAPALGLLLEAPVFEGYNKRLEQFGYKAIDFSKYQDEVDTFKMKHIYDKIYKEEVDENVFNAFFSYIDSFNKVTGAQGEETPDKSGLAVQKSIFEFLTARGIPGLVEAPESNKKVKQRKRMEEEEAASREAEESSAAENKELEVEQETAVN
ncbi:Pus1p [Saccharomyces cerevisiae x Saccharomyces kudriavzevii VIN7]|uniref:tRNA pseudouridine synthase 1 n=1 Tax=Saccharomyces cerevisiae x Saccharomyces kudriavzevii (strain VIN7) TaxID=1095631 RepID=H0H1U2_SACCK|nr:Pus1p [Saccharomyces cerevisiae x Saccharomyces kudriavzevii VIN7]